MEKSYHALLIGTDEYEDEQLPNLKWAQKDCTNLFDILTNAEHGLFPPENVIKLIGREVTLENVQYRLFSQIVQNRTKEDTVLVYISGHAFPIPYQNRIYIATYDSNIELIKQNPLKGVWMSQLHDEFFKKSAAKNLIFILDTCYSGSIFPQSTKGIGPTLIDESFYASGTGKIAIVSSPPEGLSREDDHYQNSVFTNFLKQGLEGKAAEENGDVTVDSLIAYIRLNVPPDQPAGRYGHDYGRIVLSKHHKQKTEQSYQKSFPEFEISKNNLYRTNFSPLNNQLEECRSLIDNFLAEFSKKNQDEIDITTHILDAIKLSTKASAVLLLRKDLSDWVVKSLSTGASNSISVDDYVSVALSASLRNNALGPDINGVFGKVTLEGKNLKLVTIALRKSYPSEILVICDTEIEIIETDLFAEVISGVYNATNSFSLMANKETVESEIYDYLKVLHKFLPISFYNRRFELFGNRLHSENTSVLFQPIFKFGVNEVSVSGFEALAHDIKAERSPADIFRAAEIWGRKFMLEADLYFLQTATEKYQELRLKTAGYRRPEDVQDLSVNVYPESLMRSKYFDEMNRLIKKNGVIPADKFYLEISEKTIFPKVEGEGIAVGNDIKSFRQVLEKYVHSFGIGFAIDDFGIGYSSVSRLAELHPSYLKIDREILFVRDAYNTIKFIISFVNDLTSKEFLRSAKIVLEGFDSETSRFVHLGELRRIGLQYIQGYIVGKPVHDKLVRLDETSIDYLSSLSNV
jgi:EAL domain-containing protein (putative c-di-GMP-specific phosphodiesterase class I)